MLPVWGPNPGASIWEDNNGDTDIVNMMASMLQQCRRTIEWFNYVPKAGKISVMKALKAFNRHVLSKYRASTTLFSSSTPPLQCNQLANTLLQIRPDTMHHLPEKRLGTSCQRPKFPADFNINSKLTDFVTEESWLFSINWNEKPDSCLWLFLIGSSLCPTKISKPCWGNQLNKWFGSTWRETNFRLVGSSS